MEKNNITIEQITMFSSEDADAIRLLASKLGDNYKSLTNEDLQEMLASTNTYLLVARESKQHQIVGMVTLFVYRIPYVKKSYVDDLIVDESYRGQGIATQLMEKALIKARELGASYVDFTARPRRSASNSLYEKLGFKKRDTNVYRLVYDYAEV